MTKSDKNGLSERQRRSLPCFAGCRSYDAACRTAGISKQTFYTWLRDPRFKAELDRLQEEVYEEAVGALKGNLSKAVQALVALLEVTNNPTLIRAVANDIINHASNFKQMDEVEARITSLEAHASGNVG